MYLFKQGLICLAQGPNAVTPVRLEHATLRSPVRHSTTKPLRSGITCMMYFKWLLAALKKCLLNLGTFALEIMTFRG